MSRTKALPLAAVARQLEREAKEIRRCVPLVRAADHDGIHDMRVASRRLRVALRESHAVLPEAPYAALQKAVSSVTQALGHARELDVMVLMLEEYRNDAYGPWQRAVEHALKELAGIRGEAQQECEAALQHLDPKQFDVPLQEVLKAIRTRGEEPLPGMAEGLERRLATLRKAWRDWRESEKVEDLHRVRIAVKKLRYAAEFFAPAYDKKLGELVSELKQAQELLGDWHDAEMLVDALRRMEKHAPYREVQGFPLIVEAFEHFADEQVKGFLQWARAFFEKPRRQALREYLAA